MQIYFCRTDANLARIREAATGNELPYYKPRALGVSYLA